MSKSGYSRRGLFGTINHYDSHGHKIGESRPGLFGSYNNYDANGHKTGQSRPGLFGSYDTASCARAYQTRAVVQTPTYASNYLKTDGQLKLAAVFPPVDNSYDNNGNKTGESRPNMFGGRNQYDADGNKTGHTVQGFFGDYNHYDDD